MGTSIIYILVRVAEECTQNISEQGMNVEPENRRACQCFKLHTNGPTLESLAGLRTNVRAT